MISELARHIFYFEAKYFEDTESPIIGSYFLTYFHRTREIVRIIESSLLLIQTFVC